MQYILSQQEYNDLTTKGNLADHNMLMELIDMVHQISTTPESTKRLNLLDTISEQLSMFQQDGDKRHFSNIREMLEHGYTKNFV